MNKSNPRLFLSPAFTIVQLHPFVLSESSTDSEWHENLQSYSNKIVLENRHNCLQLYTGLPSILMQIVVLFTLITHHRHHFNFTCSMIYGRNEIDKLPV